MLYAIVWNDKKSIIYTIKKTELFKRRIEYIIIKIAKHNTFNIHYFSFHSNDPIKSIILFET